MTHIIAKTGAIVFFIHILFSCNLRHNGDGANALHEKIDHFILDQQQELLDLQKNQTELMNEILKQIEKQNTR